MDLDTLSGALNIVVATACAVLVLIAVSQLVAYRRGMSMWDRTCTYALLAFFALAAADRYVGAVFRIGDTYILNPSYDNVYPALV